MKLNWHWLNNNDKIKVFFGALIHSLATTEEAKSAALKLQRKGTSELNKYLIITEFDLKDRYLMIMALIILNYTQYLGDDACYYEYIWYDILKETKNKTKLKLISNQIYDCIDMPSTILGELTSNGWKKNEYNISQLGLMLQNPNKEFPIIGDFVEEFFQMNNVAVHLRNPHHILHCEVFKELIRQVAFIFLQKW